MDVIGKRVILDLKLDEPSINGRAIQTKKTQIVYDTSKDKDYYSGEGPNGVKMLSELCVPIAYKNQVLGTINLESTKPHHFTYKEAETLERFVKEIAKTAHKLTVKEATGAETTSAKKRSTNDIQMEMLRSIKEGVTGITRICYAGKVPWYRGKPMLQQLEEEGYIILEQDTPHRKKYKITEKGLSALKVYDKLAHIMSTTEKHD